ncbi:hypothetical protein PC129_g5862 [Phytophthora cactorum]|uniref:RxLR effector PexRD54 WY domain-containing protein n=1 Tax=Phytophthora cactorum TaxID=29920 RepID=A0A329RJJ1_9STRA|nr:hypothetical protein PC114_g20431 [Phytophthora cactorum]KAG2934148.1 hypothetical protein PC115_g5244 [Phytophthora cactorum]KAG3029454.1 hypothetical protein PC120_g4267 [Phytophthora cactorum]KAG3085822.1 hypothetical protein PC121_g5097 [Phytophthora cactorum]KAG3094011.1 hypothetical protein PC122_g5919 [Phytophthora cactorum]
MLRRYAVLVLAAVFFAGSDAATGTKMPVLASSNPASVRSISTDKNHVVPNRFLLSESIAREDDEERGFGLKSIPGLQKLTSQFKTKITPGTLLNWANKEMSPDYVFLKLKLDKDGKQLFDNPDINVWAAYANAVVKSNPEEAMLTTLKARYSDDVLAKMFDAGKKVTQSNSVATKLQTQQMENWMAAKNKPNDVFKILLLDKNQVTLVATLTAHYKDRGVLGIIEAAKKVPNTATAAKRLEADQIQLWLKNGRTPGELLTLLSLDKAGDQLLASPRFQTWSKFISYYNKENPGDATTVMEKLTYHIGDEEIMRILEAARKVPSTEKAATKLQTEQFKTWLNADKIPGDVFKLLQLNKAGDDLLANPQFKYWGKYVEDLNLKPVNNGRQVSIIDALRDNFADDVLVKMILAGMKVPATKNMAQRMEIELFKGWIVNGKTPDVIFMYLNLHKAEESVFQSPLWSMYTNFLEEYNKLIPTRQTTMISAFARNYDKEALAKLLVAAKKVPSTEKLATKLQTDQIQRWLDNKDSPNGIFKALRLDDVAEDVLTSPLFNTWTTYLDAFNAKFPSEKVSMIDTFRASFDNKSLAKMLITAQEIPTMEKLATKLQADQLQRWLANKDSPEDIFRALVLDDAVDDVLSNPLLNTWASYLEDFNAKFPRSKVSMVDTFREFFGDKTLVKMLIAAKKVASTKKIASDLETSLINKWIHAKKIPAVVSKLLGADDGSVKLLRTYTAKYMKTYGS